MTRNEPENTSLSSLWQDASARRCKSALALRAYTSRLIGADRSLVLYGGGNTSLKEDGVLFVKGTGSDLAAVGAEDFTALNLDDLRNILQETQVPDAELMHRISDCKLDPAAPKPSIETLLHAALPYAFVEHAHADAVLAVANVAESATACAAAFSDLAPVVPYRHSGIALVRACKTVFDHHATSRTIGLILAFHGVVAFGQSARESYDNLMRLVTIAEEYLLRHADSAPAVTPGLAPSANEGLAESLRSSASTIAGFPLASKIVCTPATLAFSKRHDLAAISQQGPPTPQHAIYTKRVPLLGSDTEAYAADYRAYLARTLGPKAGHDIDAAPRIALSPEFGLCAFGVDEHHAAVAAEIYLHDIDIITRASAHGTYRSAGEEDIARAELEYGGFEQRVRAGMTSSLSSI